MKPYGEGKVQVCETSKDLMDVGENPMLLFPEGFHGLPPKDCGVENAMAVGRSCTEDTTVVTRSHQYQYATTTKI